MRSVPAALLACVVSAVVPACYVSADDPKPIVNPVEAAPKLEGERTAEWLVELKMKNVPVGTAIIWDVYPKGGTARVGTKRVVKVEKMMVFAGPAGEYDVLIRLVKGEDVEEINDSFRLTGNGPGPSPGPGPGPTPGPVDPVIDNTPSKLRIYVVEETEEAAGTRNAMMTNKELAARVREKGHGWRIVDKNVVGPDGRTPPADVVPYLALAAKKPYPSLFLVDEKGRDRTNGGLAAPTGKTAAADLLALLKKYGG